MLDRHHTGLIGCVPPGRSITTAAAPTPPRRLRKARRCGNEGNDRPTYPCFHLTLPHLAAQGAAHAVQTAKRSGYSVARPLAVSAAWRGTRFRGSAIGLAPRRLV